MFICSVCERQTPNSYSEVHHMDPRNKKKGETIQVCYDCGNQIHELFTNQELHYQYNNLKSLLANEKIQKWVRWIRKKTEFGVCMKRKK